MQCLVSYPCRQCAVDTPILTVRFSLRQALKLDGATDINSAKNFRHILLQQQTLSRFMFCRYQRLLCLNNREKQKWWSQINRAALRLIIYVGRPRHRCSRNCYFKVIIKKTLDPSQLKSNIQFLAMHKEKQKHIRFSSPEIRHAQTDCIY